MYTYNALGQVTTMATLDGTWTYSYDTVGQLTSAVFASTDADPQPGPDLRLQRRRRPHADGDQWRHDIITPATASTKHQHLDGTTYTYNADGNLVSETDPRGTTTYTYNSLEPLDERDFADR